LAFHQFSQLDLPPVEICDKVEMTATSIVLLARSDCAEVPGIHPGWRKVTDRNSASGNGTRAVLDFLHRLLTASPAGRPPTEKVLQGLAEAFGASGAGWAGPLEGVPVVRHRFPPNQKRIQFPWEDQPELLTSIRTSPGHAVQCTAGERSLLVAGLPEIGEGGCLLWLEAARGHDWGRSEPDLVLAAQVLGQVIPAESSACRWLPGLDQGRLQQRLQDAGTISARVAHAFDNILTGILGFAELALGQTDLRSGNRQFLEEVVRAAQQGVQLTQELHFFSRCAVSTVGPATLGYVVAEEESRLRQLLPPGIQLTVNVPADLPEVAMDAELLRQVIGHVLNNAREAISTGTVALTARCTELDSKNASELLGQPSPGRYIEVGVANSGSEISPEVRRRLFQEPFFTTKPRHRGLGLAIVYRILKAHRGGFRLTSDPKGTIVHLYLPPVTT
jgi:signal transduction histidine kinase